MFVTGMIVGFAVAVFAVLGVKGGIAYFKRRAEQIKREGGKIINEIRN